MADFDALDTYGAALTEHAGKVVEPGTEVAIKGFPPGYTRGITTTDLLGAPYIYHSAFRLVIDYARQAEQEGYDAFVIGSFSEPFLREIRSTVRIPVVSVGEANFLLACSFGRYQAHIADVPVVARLVSEHVRDYHLTERVAYVDSLGPEVDELYMQNNWAEPKAIIDRFVELGHRGIERGADVIIPVEGVLSELLWTNGVTSIGKAPVFDSFGMAWRYAELLVGLRRSMGLEVGREWEYVRASDEKMAQVRASLNIS
jgi:Asp/Glu/hydantoin racemase